ncbi:MAG: glycosyltransferase [Patescibacteria group bacterium]
MKIAYIANSRFPSEKAQSDQVMAVCSAFADLGHEVKLFVPNRRPVKAEDPFAYYHKPKTFEFERVSCIDAVRFVWLGPIGQWIQTLSFVSTLRLWLAEWKPDVVYSREPFLFLFGRFLGMNVWEEHRVHHSFFARRAMRSMDAIVALTQAAKKQLVQYGMKENQILVEPDAVDPSLFANMPDRASARTTLGISDQEHLALYTGKFLTMGMSKGLDIATQAVRSLRSKGVPLRLLAVGGTPEELSKHAGMAGEGIEFRGHVPQSDLKMFYAAADMLLMPFPYTEHYAFYMSPLKLFEYLISGVPMIVTDLPSVREIVDEHTSFIATPGDALSLEEQMMTCIQHPEEAKQKAEAARDLSKKYIWEARTRRIAAWIEAFRAY